MENINDILGKLTDEDMASLQAAAEAMFGGATAFSQEEAQAEQPQRENTQPDPFAGFGGINPAMLAKVSGLMGQMNRKDSSTDLLSALKPHLSPKRRKRADEAAQMMRMLALLPTLQQAMRQEENGNTQE